LVTEHSLKGATNYGNRATGVGTKHAVLRPRPRPWVFRSRDQDRYLDKMNLSALESRDHGLEITTLLYMHTPFAGKLLNLTW